MNIDRNDLRLVDLTIGPFAFNKLTNVKRGELWLVTSANIGDEERWQINPRPILKHAA